MIKIRRDKSRRWCTINSEHQRRNTQVRFERFWGKLWTSDLNWKCLLLQLKGLQDTIITSKWETTVANMEFYCHASNTFHEIRKQSLSFTQTRLRPGQFQPFAIGTFHHISNLIFVFIQERHWSAAQTRSRRLRRNELRRQVGRSNGRRRDQGRRRLRGAAYWWRRRGGARGLLST